MRRIYLLLLTGIMFATIANGQASSANYTFSNATTGSLTDMSSGATTLYSSTSSSEDAGTALTSIGFDFWFMGTRYASFAASSNGYMRLGGVILSVGSTPDYSNSIASTNESPAIAPFWDDLNQSSTNGQTKIVYKLTGSAPNRVLNVQWQNSVLSFNATTNTALSTFEARIYETSGKIELVYGNMEIASGAGTVTSAIGFTNGSATNSFLCVSDLTTFATSTSTAQNSLVNSSTAGQVTALSSAADGIRRIFTFTPLIPADPTGFSLTAVTGSSMTLNWTDAATNEVGYAIYRSTDGTNYNFISQIAANSASSVQSGLNFGATYYWRVYAVTEGGVSNFVGGNATTNAGTLSGTKTVGTGGDYDNLTLAFAAINSSGLSGNVDLQLITGYPATAETYPILSSNASAVGSFTVKVYPTVSGLSITSSSTTGTLLLDNGTNITFDGRVNATGTTKDLIIENTVTAGYAVRFVNDAIGNTIKYCTVRSVNTSTTSGTIVFSTTTGANGNDNNTIDNCDVKDGATTPTNAIYSSGTTTTVTQNNSGNTISNNNIYNFFLSSGTSAGVLISTGNTDWTISGNSIYQLATRTATTAATVYGISIANTASGNNFIVTGNYVGGGAPSCSGTAWTIAGAFANRFNGIGLSVATTTPSSVQNNTIANFSFASTSSATANSTSAPLGTGVWGGIYVGAGSANIGTITANTVGSGTGTGSINVTVSTNPGATANGIGCSGSGTINISNNIIGSITTSGGSGTLSTGIIGILSNATGTVTINLNAIGSTSTANSINASLASTGTTAQVVTGISNTGAAVAISITNNTIANLNNAYAAAPTTATLTLRGISSTSGVGTITGNTIRNLSNASPGLGTGTTASTMGILYTATTAGNHTVSQNTIYSISNSSATAATHLYGIHYAGPTAGTNVIGRNLIHSLTLSSTSATATIIGINDAAGVATFQNNMIRLGVLITNANVIVGIDKANTSNNNFFHNSIYIGGTGVAAAAVNTLAFRRSSTGTDDIRNNIFYNNRSNASGAGKHYNIGLNATTTATVNYNVYYGTGTGFVQGYVGTPGTTDYATFALWKPGASVDANSAFGDPQFIDKDNTTTPDLHIHPTNPTPVESAGVLIASVTDDYDAQTRSGLTPIDIGADAGNFVTLDIAPPSIVYTALAATCTPGDRSLNGVSITDVSGVPTTGTLQPRIYYKKGTGGTWYSSQGTLATGTGISGTWNFTIVAADMGGVAAFDVIYYYVIAQDIAGTPNISSNPGGAVATDVNTVGTPPSAPNNYSILGSLGTTYTVGSSQAFPFNTLTNAVNAYNNACSLTGAVVFQLSDATYSGSETFPIVINNSSASSTNTLIIRPATGVTASISGAAASAALIKITGNYVTIDGSNNGTTSRDLTITNTSITSPSVILIGSTGVTPVTNNTIKNTIVINGVNTSSAIVVSDATTLGSAGYFNNITIQNNSIQKAFVGLFSIATVAAGNGSGLSITSNDLTTSGANAIRNVGLYVQGVDGATVSGNSLANFETATGEVDRGIWFATGTVNSTMSGNTVSTLSHTGAGSGYAPVALYVSSGVSAANINVTSNIISGLTSNGTGTTSGIFVSGATEGVNILKNKITNIKNTQSTGYGANGIQLGTSSTTANIVVANNFISDIAGNGYASGAGVADNGYGIIVTSGAGYTIDYNTVSLNTNQAVNGLPACINITSSVTAVGAIELLNNIFTNSQTVGTNRYTIYSAAPNTAFSAIDYNDYWTAGPNLGFIGSNRATLADIQTGFGGNSRSQNAQPTFTSATDLHLVTPDANNYNYLESKGVVVGVTTDIDNEGRPNGSAPDIGADEFVGAPPALDVSAQAITGIPVTNCPNASVPLSVTVKNESGSLLDFAVNNLTITLNITGASTQTLTATLTSGTLGAGLSSSYPVSPNANFTADGTHNLSAVLTLTGEINTANNTFNTSKVINGTAPVTLPQTVDFTGYTGADLTTVFPNWFEAQGATSPSGTTSGWISSTLITGSGTTAKVNLYNNSHIDWIVGPKFVATANTEFHFDVAITDFASGAADPSGMQTTDDKVVVKISTDCGASFTDLYTFNAANTVSLTNVLTAQNISLSAYAGQTVILAFFATDGPTDDTPDYDFHIDNINIMNAITINAGATALALPAATGCYGATETVSITVKNLGTNTLDFSANPLSVTTYVTGAATMTLTGGLSSGTLAPNATVNVPMTSGTLNMTTAGTYTFNATATLTGDLYAGDDAMAPVNRTPLTIGGTYTVGTSGNYPTLTAAVAAYNSATCFTGPVVFTLLDASYTARIEGPGEIFPIIINSNAGAGANTLTIKPAAGVTTSLTGSNSTGAIIQINGGDKVIIDGSNNGTSSRDLTISNTTTATATAVILLSSASASDGATNNVIKNCIITGDAATTTGYGIVTGGASVGSDALTPNSNNIFQNNLISKVELGISVVGTSTSNLDAGNQVISNVMGSSTAGDGFSVVGIQAAYQDGIIIRGNEVQNIAIGGSGSDDYFGLGIFEVKNAVVDKNKIHGMSYTGTSTGKLFAILTGTATFTTSGNPSNNLISNNVVYDLTSSSTSGFLSMVGIDDEGGYGDKFYNNSVYLTGSLSGGASALATCFANGDNWSGTSCATIDVRNNIFYINGTSASATQFYTHYTTVAVNTGFTLNYNDLVSVASGSAVANIGRFNATNYTTLAAWQTATGEGVNTVSNDPLFTSATNLALQGTSPAISQGVTIAGITSDITGSTRNSPPSMGAYEDKIVVSMKVFLQGAYNSGTGIHNPVTTQWRDVLNAGTYPAGALTHPYASFGHAGTESVSPGFFVSTPGTTDVLDWVLLELRTAAPPAAPIATRAAFVREDGLIVDLDGVSPVSFKGLSSGNYYVTVRHRNHLGIRTALMQLVDGNPSTPTAYDFSSSLGQAFKDVSILTNEAMAQNGSTYLMWAGNVNQDLFVRATSSAIPPIPSDAAAILTILGGSPTATGTVYSAGDVNMDGRTRATSSAIPPIPSDAAVILSLPLGGNNNATRKEHK